MAHPPSLMYRHVDFSYEVSRSLMACEGALLVVDATQGVEAQTLANTYIAMENNLEIIPVINKIDMASAEPERVVREVEEVVGIDCSNAVMASAKSGIGIEEILSHIVDFIPAPPERAANNLRALIFDSAYDPYRGVRFFLLATARYVRRARSTRPLSFWRALCCARFHSRPVCVMSHGVSWSMWGGRGAFTGSKLTAFIFGLLHSFVCVLVGLSFFAYHHTGYCLFPRDGRRYQEGE